MDGNEAVLMGSKLYGRSSDYIDGFVAGWDGGHADGYAEAMAEVAAKLRAEVSALAVRGERPNGELHGED